MRIEIHDTHGLCYFPLNLLFFYVKQGHIVILSPSTLTLTIISLLLLTLRSLRRFEFGDAAVTRIIRKLANKLISHFLISDNLYDVFLNIRDDEAEHCKTMKACQTHGNLRSPHSYNDGDVLEDDPGCIVPQADCEGIADCLKKSIVEPPSVKR